MFQAKGTAMCGHKTEACSRYLKGTNVAGVEEAEGKVVGDELG